MAVRITHVRLSGSINHENITNFRWIEEESSETGSNTKASIVEFIDVQGVRAYVSSPNGRAEVGVIKPNGRVPYLRTYADGEWNNNLLSLPRF
ncbi:DUF3892 domain-containing protein [Arthrobacter globiformis]|uniref:DUF3892 domain-containing protein n=1 Tax=Arthrobacter globiformis TaxID=1665 RepID=A0A328HJD8_ARTGO|nr:DUF3892 domain-containing protein [Arthrobacter globiformis]RAM37350.1 DUF3892 domain-containing protein [Arthrobacter globiformis]